MRRSPTLHLRKLWEYLQSILRSIARGVMIDEACPLEAICHRVQSFLDSNSNCLTVLQREKIMALTPFTFPCAIDSVGLWVMNVPSTTGEKTKVPKNPDKFIATLADCRVATSAVRRQARVSAADVQLLSYSERK